MDEIKGKRIKINGYLEDFALTREEADNLIMNARKIVFGIMINMEKNKNKKKTLTISSSFNKRR